MFYRGGKKALGCNKCGYERPLARNSEQVTEKKMTEGVDLSGFTRGMSARLNEYNCKGCGSFVAVMQPETLEICPFCLNNDFEPSTQHEKVILPKGIIPFAIPKEAVRKILKFHFIKRNYIMLPNDIVKVTSEPDNIRGVFIPFFLFDVLTQTTWFGEGAYMFEEKGNKKKLWDPFSGYYENFYENIPIPASKGVASQLGSILPFNMRASVPYDYRYLKDWHTELYSGKELDRFGAADKKIDGMITGQVKRRIKPKEQRNFKQNTEKQNITFRHVLVPVWIATYPYKGKKFHYLINGQNGRITGDKPISFNKIYTIIGFITALVLFLVFYFG